MGLHDSGHFCERNVRRAKRGVPGLLASCMSRTVSGAATGRREPSPPAGLAASSRISRPACCHKLAPPPLAKPTVLATCNGPGQLLAITQTGMRLSYGWGGSWARRHAPFPVPCQQRRLASTWPHHLHSVAPSITPCPHLAPSPPVPHPRTHASQAHLQQRRHSASPRIHRIRLASNGKATYAGLTRVACPHARRQQSRTLRGNAAPPRRLLPLQGQLLRAAEERPLGPGLLRPREGR